MTRTNTCGELVKKDVGKKAVLCGWAHSRRDHGGLIFIDLRDRHGITQIVFDPSHDKNSHEAAEHIGREFVLQIKGKVRDRKKGMINPKLKTGEIEVIVDDLVIINKAETPPIEIEDRIESGEETRLKYRYLDLRRPCMQKKLMLRHKVTKAARDYLDKNKFVEITTPLLVKSTPEGARDYIVPSRVNPGKFYALPQSPQLYKQLLMIAGLDRYYQMAICLRDEDLRADRQPEHMQIDLEMSFMTSDEIRAFVEGLFHHFFKQAIGIRLKKFPVLSHKEAVEKYGTDKPDLRFGLELIDITETAKKSEFSIFKGVEQVKCINPEKDFSRKELDTYIEFCKANGADGMAWMKVTQKGLESSIVKYFSPELQKEILSKTKAKKGSTLMFIASRKKTVAEVLGKLRLKISQDLGLADKKEFNFCWVKDFPLFSWNETENRWDPEHHMFSMPKEEYINDFEKRPDEAVGDLWDIVLNGYEIGSGSIRVSSPEIQKRIMKFIGLSEKEADEKFGFLLNAYKYGAPIHGGMGLGLDRIVALMCGINDIREVIAFPKNKAAQCPMDGSPSEVSREHLKELHIKSDIASKSKN